MIDGLQWFFLLYFIGLNGGYLCLCLMSLRTLSDFMAGSRLSGHVRTGGLEPGISLIAPAYNEEASIVASVRSLLQLDYPEFEVIVIDDGSTDGTLARLQEAFDLTPFPEAFRVRLETPLPRGVWLSRTHPNLKVASKANGGKASALNFGINLSRHSYFCAIDADSVLQRDSLFRLVQPFLEDPRTIATGGTIRIANGCAVVDGFLTRVGLPRNFLALMQICEYLRAMLFGRLGWSSINALLIISGAFGLYRMDTVIAAGGYRTNTIGEDMELTVRLHRLMISRGEPYRITFVPDPVCWTEVPEDLRSLKNQRVRWQRGLLESLAANRGLLCQRGGKAAAWLAFPFALFFEGLGPLIELSGLLFMAIESLLGHIDWPACEAFLIASVGLGVLLSVSALLIEEMSFRLYPKPRHIAILFLTAVIENVGYRQINSWWRLIGVIRWLLRTKAQWGKMRRSGDWQETR